MKKLYTTLFLSILTVSGFAQNPAGNCFHVDYDQFQLDGLRKYFDCGNDDMLNVGDNLTLEIWLQFRDFGDNQKVIGKFGLNDSGFLLGVDQGRIYPEVWTPTKFEDLAGLMNPLAQHWHHLAVTYEAGDSLKSYINGKQVGAVLVSGAGLATNTDPLIIGIASWDLSNFQSFGNIDEVRVWDVARSATDIKENMFRELAGTETGLVAYYNFNETTGNTLPDVTGNGNTGTGNNVDADEWMASNAVIANMGTAPAMDLHGLWNGLSFQDPRVAATDNGMTLTGSVMDTADFVVFGHTGGTGTSTSDVQATAPANFMRTGRTWSVTNMGSISANVLMNLADAAGGGTALNATATPAFYTLLHRPSNSGDFLPVATGASVNNGIVSFNGVDMQNGEYTIGVGDSEYNGVGILSAAIQNIDVYPNPSNGEFYLDLSGLPNGVATLEVFAANGQVILSEQLNSDKRTLDLSEFGAGLYQLRITAGSEVFGQRLVVN
ncbi:MAG: hypothetical protein ACI85F_001921 [Bacteroidia bacterium]|jgi:hypothetical protein